MSKRNQPDKEDPMWKTHMKSLWRRKMVIEIDEMLPKIISEWYRENGLPEPQWQQKKPFFDEDGNIITPED